MDPLLVSAAVTSVLTLSQQAFGLLKGATETARTLGKTEVMNDLIQVQLAMMDILQKHQVLIDDNHELNRQLKLARELLDEKQTLEVHFDLYWTRTSSQGFDGPFSPYFWDHERKLVRLRNHGIGNKLQSSTKMVFFFDQERKEQHSVPLDWLELRNAKLIEEARSVD